MKKRRRIVRPEPKPGVPSPPLIYSVPETGRVTLRLLSEADSLFCHPQDPRPVACPGEGVCPAGFHDRQPKRFYAYVAAERWRETYGDWLPCVLEITESCFRGMIGRQLRGEVWTFQRGLAQWTRYEVSGEHVDTLDPAKLRRDVALRKVVERCYGTDRILWGVLPNMDVPSPLEASKDAPPKGQSARKATPETRRPNRVLPMRVLERMTPEERTKALNEVNGVES